MSVRASRIGLGGALVLGVVVRVLAYALHPSRHLSADETSYGYLAVRLAHYFEYGGPAMKDPLHWAPGAPAAFSIMAKAFGNGSGAQSYAIAGAHWLEIALLLASCAVGWAIVRRWGNERAAVAAAFAIALSPGLVLVVRRQLSEPQGALLLIAAVGLFGLALESPTVRRGLACGAVFGLLALTRADLVLAPLIAVTFAGAVIARRAGRRAGARTAVLLAAGALALTGPWIIGASLSHGAFVPVSSGGASTLLIGTYLPGDGTLFGFKRQFAYLALPRHPEFRHRSFTVVPQQYVLSAIARRNPRVSAGTVFSRLARGNIRRYALGDPGAFAAMMARKGLRMWREPYTAESTVAGAAGGALTALHALLVLAALAGCGLGLWRRRDPIVALVLAIVAYSTLSNMILIAESRHNVTLLPALLAAGALGIARWSAESGRTFSLRSGRSGNSPRS